MPVVPATEEAEVDLLSPGDQAAVNRDLATVLLLGRQNETLSQKQKPKQNKKAKNVYK